ncbi:two-component regulator propeller domain-containing protein [Flagellimonas myxillae]|uniref:two-component regulator propeller domain-containing protein n=1 Tax=Flagellimonas myxillae TaxID=2942214 RepID=UPI00201E80AE|nr:two-component regulator propeller domain-containing protein [Muricauda myxillae]MCL6266921.1 response regulator [Muricauda myxillae]
MKRICTTISVLVFLGSICLGQQDLRFINLGTDNGLSNGNVTAIVQDSIGFIWIGTKNGLNRYDGKHFKIYTQQNSSLSSNDISDMLLDRFGRIWVSTIGGGISRYDVSLDSFVAYKQEKDDNSQGLHSNIVHTLYQDRQGYVWAATEGGLSLFDEKSQSFTTFLNSNVTGDLHSEANNILSLYEDTKGTFWVGTNGAGIFLFDPNEKYFSKYGSLPYNESLDYVLDIIELGFDKLLLGTGGNGLVGLNTKEETLFDIFDENKMDGPQIVRAFWKDNESNIWIGTDGDGLYQMLPDGSIKGHFLKDNQLPSSLANNSINTIFQDNQQNLWFGTAWRGASVWKKQSENVLRYYSDGIGYDSQPVLSVFAEREHLMMGLDGAGLSVLNMSNEYPKNVHKNPVLGAGASFIQCIIPWKKNQYWLGTFTNGLLLFDKEKGIQAQYRRDGAKNSIPFDDVRDIVKLPSDDLWIATWGGGVSYFDVQEQHFTNYKYSPNTIGSLSNDNAIALLNDNDYLWVATHGGGLNRFNKAEKRFRSFRHIENDSTSLQSDYVFSVIQAQDNNLWLGTKKGLSLFDKSKETFTNYVIGNSINSNTVISIATDHNGGLWIGTKSGIFKFDPKTGRSIAVPDTKTEFHINAVCLDANGNIFFGGIDGVTSINTTVSMIEAENPPIVFTDFMLFNESQSVSKEGVLSKNIAISEKLTLKPNQNVFTLGLANLQFPIASAMGYEVKMEGFEQKWRSIGQQESITYTNLSPGNYTFRARLQGFPHSTGKSIQIKVLPPFWRTWWAYIVYALMFGTLLWTYRHYTLQWAEIKNNLKTEKLRREKEDEVHKLKQRFFTNISHEIRTPLTLIMGALNNLVKTNYNANEQKQLNAVKYSANRLMTLVNELLNIRKLETGNMDLQVTENNLVVFVQEIFVAFSQQAIAKNINYKYVPKTKNLMVWFDRVQLEKTIYNVLTNAFKFTPEGGKIEVLVKRVGDFGMVTVKDSGSGIPVEQVAQVFERFYQNENGIADNIGFGIGLSISKDIVEMHEGSISARNRKNGGSSFEIKLRLGKNHFGAAQIIEDAMDVDHTDHYQAITSGELKNTDAKEGITILVVEDNTYLRKFLVELLSKEYSVLEAENGKVALDLAREHLPDLVLSDIMMPEKDGVSLCYDLKTNMLTSHIPVVLLTARDMVESIMEGYETGADDYLVKPFHEGVLKTRIWNLLNNRKQLREHYVNVTLLNPKEVAFTSPDQEFLSKLQNILEEKLDESEFHIDSLALEMAMSHSSMYKKLKALTGMTLVAFIRDFRLKRAAQLLQQHKYAIADVSFKVGYTDSKHFSREFKKKFGKNPSQFAKDHSST